MEDYVDIKDLVLPFEENEEEAVYDYGMSEEEVDAAFNAHQAAQKANTAALVNSYVSSGMDLTTSIISAIQSGKASKEATKQLELQLQLLREQNKKGTQINDYATLLALMEQQQKSSKTGTYIAIGCGVALLGVLAYLCLKK